MFRIIFYPHFRGTFKKTCCGTLVSSICFRTNTVSILKRKTNTIVSFSDEDEEYKQQVQQLRESIPFAVVGANAMVEVHGKKIRGR